MDGFRNLPKPVSRWIFALSEFFGNPTTCWSRLGRIIGTPLYFFMSAVRLYSSGTCWDGCWPWTGRNFEEPVVAYLTYCQHIFVEKLSKSTKTLKMPRVPVEILIGRLPNTSDKHYYLSQIARFYVVSCPCFLVCPRTVFEWCNSLFMQHGVNTRPLAIASTFILLTFL